MFESILFALWFFLPAGAANVTPILVSRMPGLRQYNAPMDFGLMFRGKRILGEHKTWRGLLSGIVAGTLVLFIQQLLLRHFSWFVSFDGEVNYANLPVLIVGPLFAIGALGGDALKSFFKRQLNIAPGKSWFPFDQIDYIIGGALATSPFVRLSLSHYAWILLVWLIIHILSTVCGFLLHLKDQPI